MDRIDEQRGDLRKLWTKTHTYSYQKETFETVGKHNEGRQTIVFNIYKTYWKEEKQGETTFVYIKRRKV